MFSYTAITRKVSPAIENCELTHLSRESISFEVATKQHTAYVDLLKSIGCEVVSLEAEVDLPDSVFVEDAALVLDEVAVITRPGAVSRQAEVDTIRTALTPYRDFIEIEAPATLDGGDIVRIDKTIYVGLSTRSNAEAVAQLGERLEPYGYTVKAIEVKDCLHLKSAVSIVSKDTLLLNPAWIDASLFPDMNIIETDPNEAFAANAVLIGNDIIYPEEFPKTGAKLKAELEPQGFKVHTVLATELAKAEGAVTCCSLIIKN